MTVETGPVTVDGNTGRARGVHHETFNALVEDEDGPRWVIIRTLIKKTGAGNPERIMQMTSENRDAKC